MNSSRITILSLSLLIFLLISLPSPSLGDDDEVPAPSSVQKCNARDQTALLQIKAALNNPEALSSWEPKTDCCNSFWLGVQCDLGRVITLTIFNRDISGQISPAIGKLRHLQALDISDLTGITGPIPSTITRLNRLIILSLRDIKLAGEIPVFLGRLKNLRVLDLQSNLFTGAIPASFTQLSNLVNLNLANNQLCGQIPQGGALQTVDPISYRNNTCLCGAPLSACHT